MAPWGHAKELFELLAGGLRFGGSILNRRGVAAGSQKGIKPLRVGPDQFQLAVNQRPEIEEMESPEKQSGSGSPAIAVSPGKMIIEPRLASGRWA